jgi:hypothetical protein
MRRTNESSPLQCLKKDLGLALSLVTRLDTALLTDPSHASGYANDLEATLDDLARWITDDDKARIAAIRSDVSAIVSMLEHADDERPAVLACSPLSTVLDHVFMAIVRAGHDLAGFRLNSCSDFSL